jgi:hypothetical protein
LNYSGGTGKPAVAKKAVRCNAQAAFFSQCISEYMKHPDEDQGVHASKSNVGAKISFRQVAEVLNASCCSAWCILSFAL